VFRHSCALALTLLAGCCGYSTRSLLPSHLGSVAIVSVGNATTQPGLAEALADSLTAAFTADRNLRVTGPDNADLLLTVTITAYSRAAAAYDEQQTVSGYEVSILGSFEAEDRLRNEPYSSGPAGARVSYDPASQSEETATGRAVALLARDVVRAVVTAW